jgi:hypothetical protein
MQSKPQAPKKLLIKETAYDEGETIKTKKCTQQRLFEGEAGHFHQHIIQAKSVS